MDNPFTHTYFIMGVRGSGKTVLMANITKQLQEKNNWIIIRLNLEMNLLESLNAKLYHIKGITEQFSVQSFSVSAAGFASAEMQKQTPVLDVETSIEEALVKLKEKKKKVLTYINEEVPFFLRSVKKGMNSYRKYGIINSVVGSQK